MSDDDGGIDPDDIGTENTMRARAGESRIKLVVLLGANRLLVTGGLSAATFLGFVAAGLVLDPGIVAIASNTDIIDTLFSTMAGALITGTTLVVSINQLVISQENGPLGDQRERMSNALDYREYMAELVGHPSPSDPSAFLRALVDNTEKRAKALRDATDGLDDEFTEEMDAFTDSLSGNSETVRDQLDGATFGTFDVLFAALDYNYSWKIFQVERLRDDYDDLLESEHRELFDELRTSLAMFGPAREHVKTLYFQWALVSLSQLIVYAAIPALLVAAVMLTLVQPATFPGSTLGVPHLLLVTAGAFTVTVVPFLLFAAYVMRVATVAKRTLAIGPLILRESQR